MKTFELKMNRSRWISLLIVVLCVALIIMMLSPYFTYGKATTTLVPAASKANGDGTQEMLFGRTWVLDGTQEGDADYQELIVSSDGKNSTLRTTNKLRYNQQYALGVYNTALANYETLKTNLEDCLTYESQSWDKYIEIGNMCNRLARSMGKAEFTLKDRASAVVEEEEEETEEGNEQAAEEAEEDLIALSQEGDPYANDYKTLTTAMKTADRQLEAAIKARVTAEECLSDAKQALDDAYAACLTAYGYNAEGVKIEDGIDPSFAWVKVSSDAYNKALTEKFESDYINAIISSKSDDFKKWLVDENHYYDEYAKQLGITEESVLEAVADTLLSSDKKDALVEGFIKPESSEYSSFATTNAQNVIDELYAKLASDIGEADYKAYADSESTAFSAYVEQNKAVLAEKLYADLTDNSRTKAAYVKQVNAVLYRAFVSAKASDEFKTYLLDSSSKDEITNDLYTQYMQGEDKGIPDELYAEFVNGKKLDEYKEYITELAVNGAEGELKSALDKAASDNKQSSVQGNASLLYEDFAKANLESFKKSLTEAYGEQKENVEYKLYIATKTGEFKTWLADAANDATNAYQEAYAAQVKSADKKKDRETFYTSYFSKLDTETKNTLSREFFDSVEPTLSDKDKTTVYTEMNASILSKMSGEDRDKIIYSELDEMIAASDAALAKAKSAETKTTNAEKDGKASKTSDKAKKSVQNIQKQIDKVQPIFDEVNTITKNENRYNNLLKDEELKDKIFAIFIEQNSELFDNALLATYETEVKDALYATYEEAVNAGQLDNYDSMWNETKQEFIASKKAELEANGTIDEAYEKFILEQHTADFKEWLSENEDLLTAVPEEELEAVDDENDETAVVDEAENNEENEAVTTQEATNGDDAKVEAEAQETADDRAFDPNALEKEAEAEPLIMESTATVKYTKRANEDVATVSIEFANGDKKDTTFATQLNYDKVEKLSVLGFVAFPEDYADSFEATVADYKIAGYNRNTVVLLPIILFILLIVSIVLAIIKRDSFASGICPTIAGIIGVFGFLFSAFLKLGDSRAMFIICYAILLVVGAIQLCLGIKEKKKLSK